MDAPAGGAGKRDDDEEFFIDPEKLKQVQADSIAGLFWAPDEQARRIAEFEEEYPGEDWQDLSGATENDIDESIIVENGKGCADSDKGCIRKRKSGWVILNNKKGGVWRECDSRAHCEEILDAFHASKG
jgi:hypothetical protein